MKSLCITNTIFGNWLCGLALVFLFSNFAQAQMSMHVIDVGQAEAILLEFPKQAILVDAGSEVTDDNRYGAKLLVYLDAFFARRPDLERTFHSVVVSHPHIDHTKNLEAVFTHYTVKNFIEGGGNTGSGIGEVRKARKISGQKQIAHYVIFADGIKQSSQMDSWRKELMDSSAVNIRFLSGGRICNDENNASLVMRADYQGKSILLMGDAEEDDMDSKHPGLGCGGLLYRLMNPQAAFPELLDADIFKAAHHGAKNGEINLFLQKVSPEYTVISAGSPETRSTLSSGFHAWFYGHPNEKAVAEFEKNTSEIRDQKTVETLIAPKILKKNHLLSKGVYSTVWDGDIVVSISKTGQIRVDSGHQ